jgi:hypothetical protein
MNTGLEGNVAGGSTVSTERREMTSVHTETLRLVNGRRVEGALLNTAVLSPPLRRARGRREDAFLLMLNLGEHAPSHLVRNLRDAAAQAFWTSSGSVTGAMRRAVSAANRTLFRANLRAQPENRVYGGLTCVALLEEELFLAQAGPTWAAFLSSGHVEHATHGDLPHLGSARYAEVRLGYFAPQPGDTLLILDSPRLGRDISDEILVRVLSRTDIEALLSGLEQIGAGQSLDALVARWPVEAPEPVTPPPAQRVRPTPTPPAAVARPAPTQPPLFPHEEEPPAPPQPEEERAPRVARPTGRRARQGLERVGAALAGMARAIGGALGSLGHGVKRLAQNVWGGLRNLFLNILPGQGRRRTPARPAREPRPVPEENPRLMAGLALAILLVVALVTAAVWANTGNAAHQDQSLVQAQELIAQAQGATDPAVARTHWEAALATLADVEAPEATELREQAQTALDVLNGVLWIEPVLLHDFGAQFTARRMIVHGPSIFILSTAGDVLELVMGGEGEIVSGPAALFQTSQDIGPIVDMAWVGPGSARTADSMMILEQDGALIVYDPAWHDPQRGPNRIYLGGLPGGANPVAMSAYEGRLYLLDPQTPQIWRYLPEGGGYPNRPEPYFPTLAPDFIRTARDMDIDGNVYVLLEDGGLEKCYEGGPVPFEVSSVPDPPPVFVALAVNTRQTGGPILLADGTDERVVMLGADGAFNAQLRSREGELRSLQALEIDEATGNLFALAGGRLYLLPLVP